jgi:hypothetical protein
MDFKILKIKQMNIKLKHYLLGFCIGLAVFCAPIANAQCDDKLVDKTIAKSGNDALFIREFVIKSSSKGKKNKVKMPALSSKFDIRLKKGIIYRFIVEDEDEKVSQAILQLRQNNIVLAGTYDIDNQINIGNFDYLCNESGEYQVLISFAGENTGCAAGAMFAILQDSLAMATIKDSLEMKNIIYTGMDNYIDIAASDIPGGKLEVSISRGLITEEGGLYKVNVDEPGMLEIEVIAKDKNDKITETFKSEFMAVTPMLPTVTLDGSSGGLIKKTDIFNRMLKLEINNYQKDINYKIKSFEVSGSLSSTGITIYDDNKLSYRQLKLIQELSSGDNFYITNIIIEDSKGKVYHLNSMGFIISD